MKLEAVNVTKKMPRSVMFGHQNDCARRPNVDRIVAAGTSSSTPYLSSFNCRKRSSLTASASKAAWKNDTVCNHCNQGLTFDRLIKRPVNNRLNSMTIVPIRLATLVFAHAIEMSKITLAVVRLKSTSVRMNFQKAATVGTKPTRPYTIPPKSNGGTTRSGRMSNRIFDVK